jgi:hypothetical protein
MTTQAATTPATTHTMLIAREYRVQRTTDSALRRLLARVRGDRAALDSWQLRPVTPRPMGLQEEILRAQLRMLAR